MTLRKIAGTLALALISASFLLLESHAGTLGTTNKNVVPVKKLVELGKSQLAQRLKDPPSVRFRDLSLMEQIDSKTPARTLCGIFNAKNSYGGYGDEELFYVSMTYNGTVESVWLKDNSDSPQRRDEGDLSYIDRKLEYKLSQLRDYEDRCDSAKGKNREIWKQ